MRLAEPIPAVYRSPTGQFTGWGRFEALTPVGARLESIEPTPTAPFLVDFALRGEEFTGMECTPGRARKEEEGYWVTEIQFTASAQIRRLRDAIARVLLTNVK